MIVLQTSVASESNNSRTLWCFEIFLQLNSMTKEISTTRLLSVAVDVSNPLCFFNPSLMGWLIPNSLFAIIARVQTKVDIFFNFFPFGFFFNFCCWTIFAVTMRWAMYVEWSWPCSCHVVHRFNAINHLNWKIKQQYWCWTNNRERHVINIRACICHFWLFGHSLSAHFYPHCSLLFGSVRYYLCRMWKCEYTLHSSVLTMGHMNDTLIHFARSLCTWICNKREWHEENFR